MVGVHRFYDDLATWWPLISPVEEYAEEAAFAAEVIRSQARRPVRTVLELGSGGGHNAFHLRSSFAMTLVDLSPAMVDVSRRINPECEHLAADMRTVRLGRRFDAVFVHDAVDYMRTEADLLASMRTAFEHLEPGGVAVLVPDHTAEVFEEGADCDGNDGPDGRGVRYLEWSRLAPAGGVDTDYVFLLRSPDGTVESVHETHHLGLFPEATWLRLLAEAGFSAGTVPEVTDEDRTPRTFFIGHRPG
jgi:SAM-dependent methyltransferase